jgi:hypothetical protein
MVIDKMPVPEKSLQDIYFCTKVGKFNDRYSNVLFQACKTNNSKAKLGERSQGEHHLLKWDTFICRVFIIAADFSH